MIIAVAVDFGIAISLSSVTWYSYGTHVRLIISSLLWLRKEHHRLESDDPIDGSYGTHVEANHDKVLQSCETDSQNLIAERLHILFNIASLLINSNYLPCIAAV